MNSKIKVMTIMKMKIIKALEVTRKGKGNLRSKKITDPKNPHKASNHQEEVKDILKGILI